MCSLVYWELRDKSLLFFINSEMATFYPSFSSWFLKGGVIDLACAIPGCMHLSFSRLSPFVSKVLLSVEMNDEFLSFY